VTDDLSGYGLGALPDAPDERDYPLSALYASEGLVASVVLPASYASPAMPPVLDQGSSPMCVAYSSSAMKAWQDRRDQERFFDFDEPKFFGQIGGTSAGAYVRDAMERMRTAGWGSATPASIARVEDGCGGSAEAQAPGRATPGWVIGSLGGEDARPPQKEFRLLVPRLVAQAGHCGRTDLTRRPPRTCTWVGQ